MSVLIVDDDPDLRDALAFEFQLRGIETVGAGDGLEALAVLASQAVELVVSDVRMPRMGGVELLREVRQRHGERIPMMLMSGFSDVATWDAFANGANAFFAKPYDGDNIVDQAHRLMTLPRSAFWTEDPGQPAYDFAEAATRFALGRGGMFVAACPRNLRRGATISFTIQIGPDDLKVTGKGVVRWTRPNAESGLPAGCGIEFTYIAPEMRAHLEAQIEREAPVAYIPRSYAAE